MKARIVPYHRESVTDSQKVLIRMILFAMILTLLGSITVLIAVYTVRRNVRTQLSMVRSHRRNHPNAEPYDEQWRRYGVAQAHEVTFAGEPCGEER